ncbi:MAG: type VI secretion system tube protein Hcp [Caldimonas sp.]
MANSVAEAYLLILRSSMVPVIGEAVPFPFEKQIELDEWSWQLIHDEKIDGGKGGTSSPSAAVVAASAAGTKSPYAEGALIRAVGDIHKNTRLTQIERDKQVMARLKQASEAQKKIDGAADTADAEVDVASKKKGEDGDKLNFTFRKGVDLASTQLLNSMKGGEVMPRAVVTLHHRSSNAPVTLVVTFGHVTLTNYDLSVDVSETMADMRETWTASYETVDYVYKNRPAAGVSNGITQGTARVFKMKKTVLF